MLAVPPATAMTNPAEWAEAAVRVEKNLTYACVGGDKLMLDLAIPPGDGPFPCIVMLHGGAWQGGSREEFSSAERGKNGKLGPSWIETIAEKGYVTATIGYRLAPKHKFPAMIEDARAAVRFLRANAKEYRIDAEKLGAIGFSAGGHLALLLGLCDKSAGFDVGDYPNVSGKIQCIVDFFGPTDLSLYGASPGLEDGYMVPFLGKECKADPNVYKKASPISYVSKDAPPILLLHGTFDLIVPAKHSEVLLKALTDAGATAELLTFPLAGHGGWDKAEMERAQTAAFQFLDTHLKGKK
jgi:acetyl esterase/lipase